MNLTKKVDALGFDKFEIANIRRCAAANKTNYKKIDAIKAKIIEYGKLLDSAEALAETWDAPAKKMSVEKLGVELTAREIMFFHENPEKFYEAYPQAAANFEQETPVGTEGEAEANESNEPLPF